MPVEAKKAKELLYSLFDEGSAFPIDELADGGRSGAECAWGTVDGCPVYGFVADGDGFGCAAAAKIGKIYSMAASTGAPVVGFYDSLGARLGDGAQIMSALGGLMGCVSSLSGVVPQISVVSGTCGGSMAMIASCADLLIAVKDCEFFLTAPSVIKAADKANKSEVGTAAAAFSNGTAACVAENGAAALAEVRKILGYMPANNLEAAPAAEEGEPEKAGDIFDSGSFCELYAGYGKTIRVGFASVAGQCVGSVSTAADENGRIGFDAVSKAARFVKLCDAYSIPVVTTLDAEGFCRCGKAEADGSVAAAAALSHAYAQATTAKIAVVTGRAMGPLYIAAAGRGANADMVFAAEGAVISPLGIEAEVLINEPEKLAACTDEASRQALFASYAADRAGAKAAASAGLVDAVVSADALRGAVVSALDITAGKRQTGLPRKHSII